MSRDVYLSGLNLPVSISADPLLHLFVRILGRSETFRLEIVWQLAVLGGGIFFLLRVLPIPRVDRFLAGALGSVVCALAVGFDPVLLRIHWFPWLLWACLNLAIKRSILSLLVALPIIGLWASSAGPLAVLGIVIAALFAICWSGKLRSLSSYFEHDSRVPVFALGCIVAVAAAICLMPEYRMPDFPLNARLVNDTRPDFHARPLVGPYLSPAPVNAEAFDRFEKIYLLRFILASCVLLIVVVLAATERKLKFNKLFAGPAAALVVCFVVIYLQRILPSNLIELAPYPILARFIPGLALLPLPWAAVPFGLSLAVVMLSAVSGTRALGAGLYGAIIVLVFTNLSGDFSVLPQAVAVPADRSAPDWFTASPSGFVASVLGPWVLKKENYVERQFEKMERVYPRRDAGWTAFAHPNPGHASLAMDGSEHTYWSTERGQEPGDVLRIEFAEPEKIIRAVLLIKKHRLNFPQSLRVMYQSTDGAEHEAVSYAPWSGPARWTAEGYPFFGPHENVIIDFPTEVTARSLSFRQTGKKPQVDWIVEEVRLYRRLTR